MKRCEERAQAVPMETTLSNLSMKRRKEKLQAVPIEMTTSDFIDEVPQREVAGTCGENSDKDSEDGGRRCLIDRVSIIR